MFEALSSGLKNIGKHSDAVLAMAVVGIVLLLIIPLPPVLLDAFLAISIVLAVTTLLLTMYTEEALDFNSFPSLLLFLTLFRLGLNVASTRMILSEAQAGDIIRTFGEFVTGGNLVVGVIIFILLTVINFVVITKGSGRIAEVSARFTLDAMPGKQMSIDADLNAGIIDEEQAKTRREKVNSEADFYGAMDGASKFVRGDAIAGIVITIVNLIGGFFIGMALKGMNWSDAMQTYTVLSIGDGLVSQIPALLISVGSGILVTRASASENLGETFSRQLFGNARVMMMSSGIIFVMGLIPGMPMLVMFPVSIALGAYSYTLFQAEEHSGTEREGGFGIKESTEVGGGDVAPAADDVEKALFVDLMEIELGYGLIPLVDKSQGGDLLARINVIRRQIASELGLIVPPIRIRDNMVLESDEYVIKIKGMEIAKGILYLDSYLAMNPGNVEKKISGVETVEPAFGLPAIWISTAQKETAEMYGYTVVDTLSVLATHLTEVIHSHANELLNRQEVSRLIDNAKEFASAVVEELIPEQLTLGQVLKVLQNLLKERVPIRDIVTILETLADHAQQTKDPRILTEYVRQSLGRIISRQYADASGAMHAATLDMKVEQMLNESVQESNFGTQIVIRPGTVQKIVDKLNGFMEKGMEEGVQIVVLTSPSLRPFFRNMIERQLPRLPVLSFQELTSDLEIVSKGVVASEVLI